MRVQHPIALQEDGVVDDAVDVDGDLVPIDEDGCFEAPRGWAEAFADRYDTDLETLRVGTDPTCATGETDCSRTVDEPGDLCWQHSED